MELMRRIIEENEREDVELVVSKRSPIIYAKMGLAPSNPDESVAGRVAFGRFVELRTGDKTEFIEIPGHISELTYKLSNEGIYSPSTNRRLHPVLDGLIRDTCAGVIAHKYSILKSN